MTTRSETGAPRPTAKKSGSVTASSVGPVVTSVAAVISAVVMFGLGVLLGLGVSAALGLHGGARSGTELGLGAALGLVSAVSSARRHLPGR